MIKGLKTEHFEIQEWEFDKTCVELKINGTSTVVMLSKDNLEELKELIETCSKYIK